MEELQGSVENIIFASSDGRFSVFRLRPDGQRGVVTVTVQMEPPLQGQQLELKGYWVEHPRFGQQFKAEHMMVAAPTSLEGIERFLASGAIDGVGPVNAKRIVAHFGGDALEIIEKAPNRLKEVSGIGAKTAKKIHDSYMEKAELRQIMIWLEQHNVSGIYAGKIYAQYGSFSVEVMESNPYRLAREIDGVGFATSDAIAAGIGMQPDDPIRVSAALEFQLQRISLSGHCCVPENLLVDEVEKALGVHRDTIWEVLKQDLATGVLNQEVVGDNILVYPEYLYQAEVETAEHLLFLQKKAKPINVGNSLKLVEKWELNTGITLADRQKEAIQGVLEHGIFVLTGGPGTGKTTVIRGMIDMLEAQGMEIILGAPTGRAAKRLSEATGRKASTIHRMLEAQGGESSEGSMFGRDIDDQLEADAIILDEVSMMDIVLMRHFLEAVPAGCHVILVGDVDQLPAVGPGSVLKDILRSGVVSSVCLTEVFRQSEASSIVMNAHAINAGRVPRFSDASDNPSADFEFIELNNPEAVEYQIVNLCRDILPKQGYSPFEDIQVLSPMHRQACGVENLNKRLQAALNPPASYKPEFVSSIRSFRLGDKVMQTKNNYDKGVFNGDIGFIEEMNESSVTASFGDDLKAVYEKAELSELQLAYCMSVHKSQGSEYPVVILPLVPGHRIMLQRNLLYTAITRAKKKVILIGTKAALNTAVANDRTRRRYTLLAERLAHSL
ncbi:exodeoxyribonuclease V alpha subunit [Anaerovibrio lipolyticus DSM 3074]|uniref:ATP-dependent RecD2 DNA helicase n=1 Tax=Anaerovibrio lipolyticus DSM 3074 TaxID=1120997 RepID=A0A1M6EFN7_9FIRM|nr:ATP-dependent RecD-like DNA helicase [Anaerovibrio lipolyticus]SHI84140.1 exodeoxyribonuclease V alpha subunit [Anaerovibrio lipolyticus DSM 3074]